MYAVPSVEPKESAAAQFESGEQLKLATERVADSDTVDCTASAILGPASQVLVAQARESVMLVVGSRGRGALSPAVLGSVSCSVLHHATGPVTIVPEHRNGDGTPPRGIGGVDHTGPSRRRTLPARVHQHSAAPLP